MVMSGEKSVVIGDTYTLGAVIGRGGQAVVHQAWQRKAGAFVAIKKLKCPEDGGLESIATEIELLCVEGVARVLGEEI